MNRKLALAAALTITTLSAAAVSAGPAVDNLPTFKAGLSTSFLGSPFFVVLTTLTTQVAKSVGLTWLQPSDAQSDPGKQISDIQTLINSGARGLIVVPRDSDAIAPALKYAASKNVAVVAIDVGIHTGSVAMTVRADNVAMARSACEAVGSALKGKGTVLELQGDLLNSSGRERTEGFEACISKSFAGVQIIARPTRWEQGRAAEENNLGFRHAKLFPYSNRGGGHSGGMAIGEGRLRVDHFGEGQTDIVERVFADDQFMLLRFQRSHLGDDVRITQAGP